MLLTLFVDPPFLLFLGYLFACALPLASARPIQHTRAFRWGLATVTIFNIAAMVAYLWYPDWMWMYIVHASEWSATVHFPIMCIAVASYYLLFLWGFDWGLRRRLRNAAYWPIAVSLLLASGVILLPVLNRYLSVGSRQEFQTGMAITLYQSPLAMLYNIAIALMLLIGGCGFWLARREKG
ncbi:MAG: hypothetical protein HYV02_06005 [Deltaproteobacteria bacterium]|nr:hypothetical protein [Deltaproteobacteria bacterium]